MGVPNPRKEEKRSLSALRFAVAFSKSFQADLVSPLAILSYNNAPSATKPYGKDVWRGTEEIIRFADTLKLYKPMVNGRLIMKCQLFVREKTYSIVYLL